MKNTLTKTEVCKELNCTESSIERFVKAGKLSVTYHLSKDQRIELYNQSEVLKLKDELSLSAQNGQVVQMLGYNQHLGAKALARQQPPAPPPPTDEQLVGLLAQSLQHLAIAQQMPLHRKLGLSVHEAVTLTGLPETVIRAAIKENRLMARKQGSAWHIKRRDLDQWFDSL